MAEWDDWSDSVTWTHLNLYLNIPVILYQAKLWTHLMFWGIFTANNVLCLICLILYWLFFMPFAKQTTHLWTHKYQKNVDRNNSVVCIKHDPPPLHSYIALAVITQKRVAAAPRPVNSASVLSLRRDCRKFTRRWDLRGGLSRSVGSVSYLSLRKPLPGTSSVYRERVSIWASARLLRRSAFEILFVCSPKIKTRNFQIHSFLAPLRSTLLYIGWLHRHQMPARCPEDNWRREERGQRGGNERDTEGVCTRTERKNALSISFTGEMQKKNNAFQV